MQCKYELTYYIYDEYKDKKLPNGAFYFDKIVYRDTFYIDYFNSLKWKQLYNKQVTYSNLQELSMIKNNIDNIENVGLKHKLYELIKGKYYCLDFILIDLNEKYIDKIKRLYLDNSIWFLKKSLIESYGGYDVFPIKLDESLNKNIERAVVKSNYVEKYKHNIFVFQKGVQNPMLLDSKKFDIRMYGLIVFTQQDTCYYFFKYGIIRKTIENYNKHSVEQNIQLTNTTFNKKDIKDDVELDKLTELFCENHILYKHYENLKKVYIDIMNLFNSSRTEFSCVGYQFIGLDYIIDENSNIFILEINKYPAIYYDENKIKYMHKNMEYNMFDKDFFDISFRSITYCRLLKDNTKNYDFCLYFSKANNMCDTFERTYYIYNIEKDKDLRPEERFSFSNGKYHEKYFISQGWAEKYKEQVTYSNYQIYSLISNKISNILILTQKDNLYENIKGKYYCLDFVVFDITKQDYRKILKENIELNNSLWFLKKSAVTTLGGYDVFPIYADINFVDNLQKSIIESNKEKKYISSKFVLQRGVDSPLLIDNKKFDFRMYGLIVYSNDDMCFYFFKMGIIRKTLLDYDKSSTKRDVQLTNTTFNKKYLDTINDYDKLTEVFDNKHKLYKFYARMRDIYIDVMNVYKDKFDIKTHKYGYHLIGLDYIIDKNSSVFLLEINRSPAIYYDEDRVKYLHKGMEFKMFNNDFFDLTINYVINCNLLKNSTEYFDFCFSFRK